MLVTQSEYARLKGFTPQYVRNLINRHIINLTPGKKINVEAADAALAAIETPAKARKQTDGAGRLSQALLQSRVKTQIEQAKRLELRNKVDAGEYIRADDVKEAAFRRAREWRDALLNVADRIAALVAAETDPKKCHQIITDECRRTLDNAADRAAADAGEQALRPSV